MFKDNRFDVFVAWYIFGVMVAELMGAKTFQLMRLGSFSLDASVAIFVMPFLFMIPDVITEVYGPQRARRIVRLGLMAVVLQLFTALLFTRLPTSQEFASNNVAYDTIFGTSIRFAIASLAAFASSELLDITVFSKVKQRMGKRKLWLRTNLANFSSQFVDSAVFLTVAFYAANLTVGANASFITGLLIPYWLLRCGLSVIETPFVYAGVRWLRPTEKHATIDTNQVAVGEVI